jgi:hypothetical protein
MTMTPLLFRKADEGELAAALALLDAAGYDRDLVGRCLGEGVCTVLVDPADDRPAASAVYCPIEGPTVELCAFACRPEQPDAVLDRLLAAVADAVRARGARHLVSLTTHKDCRRVAALQRAGFRRTTGGDDPIFALEL